MGPDEVVECSAHADLFVLPSFHEGYGMVAAEAIAPGIPVVGTPTGAVFALVGEEAGAATLFALNYDGRMACTPEDPEDEGVRGLMNCKYTPLNRVAETRSRPALQTERPQFTRGMASHMLGIAYRFRTAPPSGV